MAATAWSRCCWKTEMRPLISCSTVLVSATGASVGATVEATGAGAAGAAAAAFGCAAFLATFSTASTTTSDFLETFLTAGAVVDLLIVLVPVEVFDMIKRVMTTTEGIWLVKFYCYVWILSGYLLCCYFFFLK